MSNIFLEFDSVVRKLVEMKLNYAVCGGLAVGLYGYIRATEDIDFVLDGAGAQGMAELELQTRQLLDDEPIAPEAFAHRIGFNLIPHIDVFQENGYTKEELKMLHETRKMLHDDDLMVSCTCVRVPVLRAHSEALNLEFAEEITPAEAKAILEAAPGVTVVDNPEAKLYPMPIDATDQDDILVGRIRQDCSRHDKCGLDIFVSGDQILKGAALNAVQIAELL